MAKRADKKEVYKLLIGTHPSGAQYQFSASKIADSLGISRQYVHQLIKEFQGKNLIKCVNSKDYIKFYSATHRTFESVYRGMSSKVSRRMSSKPGPRPELAVQKARYEIVIEREYTDFFENMKEWKWGNCACKKFETKIYDQMGIFQFAKTGKKKVIVIVPEMVFKKEELSIAKHTMFAIAYESLKWFAKYAKIKFKWETMHMCQKPHITRPAKDSRAIRVTKDWSLSIDGKMLDMSSGKADWETVVFDDAVVDVVDALETWDAVSVVKSELESFNVRLFEMEEIQPKINEKIDKLIGGMKELKEMIKPPKKPIDPDDPAFW